MEQTIRKKRSDWGRRWMTLVVCICIALLLASISVTDSAESRWGVIFRGVLPVAALLSGIYEFIRPDKQKREV